MSRLRCIALDGREIVNINPHFGMCCFQGKIKLAPLHNLPPELNTLFRDQTPQAKGFRENICRYNNALAMTSLGCKVDESVNRGNGPYVFKIQGCLSHLAGSLLPQEGESPVYAKKEFAMVQEEFLHAIGTEF